MIHSLLKKVIIIDKKALGRRIRAIRLRLGLTMEDFIERIDSKPGRGRSGTVNNWETGKNAPNKKRLKKIADLGGVSVEYLINGSDISNMEAINLLTKATNYNAIKGLQLSDDEKKKLNEVRLTGSIKADQAFERIKSGSLELLNREKEMIEKDQLDIVDLRMYNGFLSLFELLKSNDDPEQLIDFETIILSLWQIATGEMKYDKNDFLPSIDKLLSSFPVKKDPESSR